jgi:hypothetical protein
VVVEDSVIKKNHSGASGSGIYSSTGFLLVQRTLIEDNGDASACAGVSVGGGIAIQNVEEAYVLRSTIRGNKHCRGAGVHMVRSTVHIEQSTITQNKSRTFGGGVGAIFGGTVSLKLNTIAENEAASTALSPSTNYPHIGGGIALYLFTGDVVWRGNVVAKNRNFTENSVGKPDDFTAFKDRTTEETTLKVKLGFTNNISKWTMAKSPADYGLSSPLIGLDPLIGSLVTNQGRLPFYLPAKNSSGIYRKYAPSGDFRTQVPTTDQRLFKRPSVTTTTPGAIDPDATTP